MSININPIETYVPTIYVNNSEPDLDETNLNHAEQALKRVTDAANAASLALESLDSAKIDAAKIVNNLLATDTSTVLSGPMGKALGDRLTAAENLLTKLNGEMVNGKLKGYIEVGDEDDIIEILQTLFNGYGFSYITISNPSKNVPSGFSYSGGFVVHRWDTLSVILLSYSISKIAINSCIKKNNAYTWTGWKIFTGN